MLAIFFKLCQFDIVNLQSTQKNPDKPNLVLILFGMFFSSHLINSAS